MNEISIDGAIELEDFMDLNMFYMKKNYKLNFTLFLLTFSGLLFIVMSIVIEKFHNVIFLGVFLLLFPLMYYPILKRSIKKIYRESPILKQKMTITINQERVVEVSETTTGNFTWDKILHIGETEKHIFIFITKAQAIVINKDKLSGIELENLNYLIPNNIKRI